jgi:hypothetical protein
MFNAQENFLVEPKSQEEALDLDEDASEVAVTKVLTTISNTLIFHGNAGVYILERKKTQVGGNISRCYLGEKFEKAKRKRQKGHDGGRKTTCRKRGKKYFQKGGG